MSAPALSRPATAAVPAPAAPIPPALPVEAPRSGFAIRVPPPGAYVLVCPGCRDAVALSSLRWFPGRRQVGCVACVTAERVKAR